MDGWADRQPGVRTGRRRNLPTDQVNEASQHLEPSRGAEGTDKGILIGPAALEFACRVRVDLTPLPRIQSSPG